jgi:hypothetical protein
MAKAAAAAAAAPAATAAEVRAASWTRVLQARICFAFKQLQ